MSVWLTEQEFRQSGAQSTGVTLNVAFLHDIKTDNVPVRERTGKICKELSTGELTPKSAVDCLSQFRDSLETYFALEEFYGYFGNAPLSNPMISQRAKQLRSEHESLFLSLNVVIDLAEQIVYHECSPETTLCEVTASFSHFADQLNQHEQREMDLMMRLCNEEIGVGD